MEGAGGPEAVPALAERRASTLLSVAAEHRAPLPVAEFTSLLPEGGPSTRSEVEEYLRARGSPAIVAGAEIRPRSGPEESVADRRRRAERFLGEGAYAAQVALRPVAPLVRTIAVTGSTAYGLPEAGDDLDFLVIVRRGSVWPFLLYAYLAARFRPVEGSDRPSEWCFNYVMDEHAARSEFSVPQGFLYAREALTARPLYGADYYRTLLGSSAWLRAELPRLHSQLTGAEGVPPPERPAPALVRGLNALLYPWIATYLHLVALKRNHRLRADGRPERRFRILAHPRRLRFETARFERLAARYLGASRFDPPRSSE